VGGLWGAVRRRRCSAAGHLLRGRVDGVDGVPRDPHAAQVPDVVEPDQVGRPVGVEPAHDLTVFVQQTRGTPTRSRMQRQPTFARLSAG